MSDKAELTGPDLARGIAASELEDGKLLLGHAAGEAVLLARSGSEVFAVSATCPHYGGPLAEGLLVGETLRCPWHHACFSLRTGEALTAPALDGIACWDVEKRDGLLRVLGKSNGPFPAPPPSPAGLSSVVIVGGGAAGHAAAEMLRREGYDGRITLLSADSSLPCDRPNLSKDYLAGTLPEAKLPLRPTSFFTEHRIDLVLGARVTGIDVARRCVVVEGGGTYDYDALLLATGSEPIELTVPGGDLPHVHCLRTRADCQSIIGSLAQTRQAVVVGASFIALEVAAALRARNIEVHVVAPEARPLEHVLGPELGDFIRALHEEHGVTFHLGQSVQSIDARQVTLKDGTTIAAELVVVGIGVRPAIALAEQAGLRMDRGVAVDHYLETSAPGIFAAGDIARWPGPGDSEGIRVEHWVVAERQGQLAARNILGRKQPCTLVPFFWSQHYDVSISYLGHAEKWDRIEIVGSITGHDGALRFVRATETVAVVTVGRDLESLRAESALERLRFPA